MKDYLNKTGLSHLWAGIKARIVPIEQAVSVASLVFTVNFNQTTGKLTLSRPEGESRLTSASIDPTTGQLKITINTN